MWESAFFTVLLAHTIDQEQYFASVLATHCIAICIFISTLKLDKADRLPTYEEFRDLMTISIRDQAPREDEECPICYDSLTTTAKLPCDRHYLCEECVQRLYGIPSKTNRCPICSVILFDTRAPWDNFPTKILVCGFIVNWLTRVLDLTILILEYTPGQPYYYTFRLLDLSPLLWLPWILVRMYLNMSYAGRRYWNWWVSGPIGDGILLFCPWLAIRLWYDILEFQKDMESVLSQTSLGGSLGASAG